MDVLLEEELLRSMVTKCLKFGKEIKHMESEISLKRKRNVQLKQHINELNKEIDVFEGKKADEQKCWDVIEMSECRVDVLLFEENRKTHSNNVVTAQTEYRCQFPGCTSILKNKWVFNRHQNIHKARYRCRVCHKCATSSSELNLHLRTHIDGWHCDTYKIYRCQHPGCERTFKNKSSLTEHQNIHLDKYRCRFCRKCLPSQSQYQNHIRTHTGERPFVCNWIGCGERFKTSCTLKGHVLNKHGNKFKFKCEVNGCGKLFKWNKSLKQHLKYHSSDRPFPCQVDGCDSRFKVKLHLTRHVEFVHNDKKEFRCDFGDCKKVYKTQQCLRRHRKTHS